MRDGELFVCGRIKTQIIIRGRKLAPEDIEATAQAAAAELASLGGLANLFSTHPPTEQRVARLQAMASGRLPVAA